METSTIALPDSQPAIQTLVADVNNDGKMDVLSLSNGSLDVTLGAGFGAFGSTTAYDISATGLTKIVDLNLDGKPDLVYTNGPTVGWVYGNGDGTFSVGGSYTEAGIFGNPSTFIATVGDANGDNLPDIFLMSDFTSFVGFRHAGVRVLTGTGDTSNSFSGGLETSGFGFLGAQANGDFNADGKQDMVVGDNTGSLTTLVSNGDGTFQSVAGYSSSTNRNYSDFKVGDFNRDGKKDLVATDTQNNKVLIFLGNGDGTFQSPYIYETAGSPAEVSIADIDGDGITDLVITDVTVGGANANRVEVKLGSGSGSFYIGQTYFDGQATSVAIGNLNADTRPDLVIVPPNSTQLTVAFNAAGISSFSLPPGPYNYSQPVVVTLRTDGGSPPGTIDVTVDDVTFAQSIALTNSGIGQSIATLNNLPAGTHNIDIYYNPGSTDFRHVSSGEISRTIIPAPLTVSAQGFIKNQGDPNPALTYVISGFVNGDTSSVVSGTPVLSTTATTGSPIGNYPINVDFSGLSAANYAFFAAPATLSITLLNLYPATPTSLGVGLTAAPLAMDLNGDGKPDLVAPSSSNNTVSVLLGTGSGTFQAAVSYPAGTGPGGLAAADLNNDGFIDLIVANSDGNVSILKGNGNGTFQAPLTFAAGGNPKAVVLADFNADGKLDLATSNYADGTVAVLLGHGDGTFAAPLATAVGAGGAGNGPWSLVAADINHDGKTDLVSADGFSHTLSVLLGNGNGTFLPKTTLVLPASGSALDVSAVDLNRDGILDLVAADYSGRNIDVWLGKGAGLFNAPTAFTTGNASPQFLTIADVNGDGKLDVVCTPAVLMGLGDGTFVAPAIYSGGTGQAVADFNLDGRADVAIMFSSFGSRTLRLLLNQLTPAPTIALATSASNAPAGTSINLTATLRAAAGSPTGTVQFVVDGANFASPIALSATDATHSQAILTTSSIPAGSHLVQAAYIPTGQVNPTTISSAITENIGAPTVISNFGGAVTYQANAAPVVLSVGGTVSDADGNYGGSILNVQLTNGAGNDRLSIQNQGTAAGQIGVSGGNVTYGGVTLGTLTGGSGATALVVTLNASATQAAEQALLQNIVFYSVTSAPATFDRTVKFFYTDGGGAPGTPVTKTVHVNVPSVIATLGSPATYLTGKPAVVITSTATLGDADADYARSILNVSIVTNGEANDRLTIGNQGTGAGQIGVAGNALSFAGTSIGVFAGGSNGAALVATLNVNATQAAIQALLRDVLFSTATNAPATILNRTVQFQVTDGGGAVSAPANINVRVNAGPAVSNLTSGLNYVAGSPAIVIGGGASVVDPNFADYANTVVTVQITNGGGSDRLSIQNQGTAAGQIGVSGANVTFGGNVIGTFTGGTANVALVVTLNGNPTQAAIQALVRNIQYANASPTPSTFDRNVKYQLTDGAGAVGPVATQTVHVILRPSISNLGAGITYHANGQPAIISATATVSDGTSQFANSILNVQLTNGGGSDRLAIQNQGVGAGQIGVSGSSVTFAGTTIGSFTGGNGTTALVVTLNASATQASIQALVRAITFANIAASPATYDRTVKFQITNGGNILGPAAVATVHVSNP